MLNETVTQTLGRYVAHLRIENAPPETMERLRCFLLYNLSVGLAGIDPDDSAQRAVCAVYKQPGVASVIGTSRRLAAADAACVNAALITARGQNDTHPSINGHLGCVVIPAVVALAQERCSNGNDILAGLLVGYEVPPRIAVDVVQATTARGFRGTSIYAIFGAAAGCARLLRLDAMSCANALAIAANFASGLTQCYAEGTPEWSAQVAEAARGGITAALLAEAGLTAATSTLEGSKGFYAAFAGVTPTSTENAPATSGLDEVTFKPFPGCAINQLPVVTLLEMIKRESIDPSQVASIQLLLSPGHANYPGVQIHGPFESEASAIMSAPFMLQTALEKGTLHARDFAERFGEDPLHVRSRTVHVGEAQSLRPFECKLSLTMLDGTVRQADSLPSSALVLNDQQTRDLCRSLADEWSCGDPETSFDQLHSAVKRFVGGAINIEELAAATEVATAVHHSAHL